MDEGFTDSKPGEPDSIKDGRPFTPEELAERAKNQRSSEADDRARNHELHPVERIEALEKFKANVEALFKHMGLKLPTL